MDTLKQEITRQLEELSPEEFQAVHQLITTFKRPSERTQDENAEQPAQSNALAPEAVRIRDGRRDTSSLRSGRKVREVLGAKRGPEVMLFTARIRLGCAGARIRLSVGRHC